MFQRSEAWGGAPSGSASLTFGQAQRAPGADHGVRLSLRDWFSDLAERDLVPDLGTDIGSLAWFRGFAVCITLCTLAVSLGPDYRPIPASQSVLMSGPAWEETRAQSIAPLAWGGDTGRRMAANDLVVPLGSAPERPTIELTATLGQGDGFSRLLQRAGVTGGEAARVSDMVATVTPLADIKPGTVMKLVLGRRASPTAPRPLDSLDFRARLDMSLSIRREAGALALHPTMIAVDRTPLRLTGLVGDSLYRAARAAGAPPQAVETYIRAIGSKLSFATDIGADAKFDLVVERARAETGEVEYGRLLYAGLTRGNRATQLQQWTIGGRTEWFEASGVGERRGGFTQPVAGARQTSGFGMRFHPVLGYSRMHQGVDFGAPTGSPIRAVTDGVVVFAGRKGGYGNHIRLNHAGNLSTTYSHMSGYAVSAGSRVLQGQIIGYVGTTGLSTGPHLHFETYRNGIVVDPHSVSFLSAPLLEGRELAAFRAKLATYQALPVNGQQE